jgi:hypothetical protein
MKIFQIIRIFLVRKVLEKIIKNKCGDSIPRSGKEGACVRCYSLSIFFSEQKQFLIDKLDKNAVYGRWLDDDGRTFRIEGHIPFCDITARSLRVRHYYGYCEILYFGFWDYIFTGWSGLDKCKADVRNCCNWVVQFFYNKKPFVMKKRYEILHVLVDKHMNEDNFEFNEFSIMDMLHSNRWFEHPNAEKERRKLRLYLDSFVKSGEMTNESRSIQYRLTGKAIVSLDEYESSMRMHNDNVQLQWAMVLLSVLLFLAAIVQAGLIKCPSLLDFTK